MKIKNNIEMAFVFSQVSSLIIFMDFMKFDILCPKQTERFSWMCAGQTHLIFMAKKWILTNSTKHFVFHKMQLSCSLSTSSDM
jgi:hypothetical protein